ncbi:MAG TPA: response regulator [Rhodanobacteraceae bacterium]|jgi:PAS domain S-box-containing protein|nr:response regulator [Rhodanobacteraceae bacterium]
MPNVGHDDRIFDQLVSGIADYAIFMLDVDGHVRTWNVGAQRIKGYRPDEIIGRNFSVFYTAEDRAAGVPEMALRVAREEGKFEAEAWRLRKDGTRFFANVMLDALRDEEGKLIGFAKITRDMTEKRAMQEQLAQSQKMEAIGQLTGGVAHDFNNLLTVIIGNLDIIALETQDEQRRRQAIRQAMHGAKRAAKLTQQLLAFSRRQPLNPKATDINKLVIATSELLHPLLGESISMETILGGGTWFTDVDAHQLENALVNLAVNARDAMPDGGKLTIETANAHLDELYRELGNVEIEPGQYVLICVTDNGTGMTKDVLEHAFDPFYTTKPTGQGTGLGLSQVYGFIKQSGGHVKIYTELGEGTTVKIYLPRLLQGQETPKPRGPRSIPRGSETILVVEDDDGVRQIAVHTLRNLGFHVLESANGKDALVQLAKKTDIDLLFTDVGLPGMNGRQLAEQARQLRPDLRILFTTGYARNAIVHQGRLDPGVELLPKPYTRERLAVKIREILDAPTVRLPASPVALVVEDEAPLREVVAYVLKSLGFQVLEAASAGEAEHESGVARHIDVALVDLSLGAESDGVSVVRMLRRKQPKLPVMIVTGRRCDLASLDVDSDAAPTALLHKPYDLESISAALTQLGMNPRRALV